jgi:hypothetical protein
MVAVCPHPHRTAPAVEIHFRGSLIPAGAFPAIRFDL